MEANPYQSPKASRALAAGRFRVDQVGFSLSLIGVAGLLSIGLFGETITTIGVYTAFLCLPGLVASFLGLLRPPRRLAAWGAGIGIFGSLFLPTLSLSLSILREDVDPYNYETYAELYVIPWWAIVLVVGIVVAVIAIAAVAVSDRRVGRRGRRLERRSGP